MRFHKEKKNKKKQQDQRMFSISTKPFVETMGCSCVDYSSHWLGRDSSSLPGVDVPYPMFSWLKEGCSRGHCLRCMLRVERIAEHRFLHTPCFRPCCHALEKRRQAEKKKTNERRKEKNINLSDRKDGNEPWLLSPAFVDADAKEFYEGNVERRFNKSWRTQPLRLSACCQ